MAEEGPQKPGIEIINQSDTVNRLNRLINEAQRKLLLVSPYVSLDKLRTLVRHLHNALGRGVKVQLIIRAKDVSTGNSDPLASEAIQGLCEKGMELCLLKDLHAKIYLSERNALLTSLNLLESSFNNSIEVGAWLTARTPEYAMVESFIRDEIQPTSEKVAAVPKPAVLPPISEPVPAKRRSQARRTTSREDSPPPMDFELEGLDEEEGACIRCAASIGFNQDRPLCKDCFTVWKRYGDPNHPEKHCHSCGDRADTSLAKPLCRDCFQESRNAF
jgi:phosphatidylserine/phosphatidylglycerophosphate/cardiolipin synthase-like enzyme